MKPSLVFPCPLCGIRLDLVISLGSTRRAGDHYEVEATIRLSEDADRHLRGHIPGPDGGEAVAA